MLGALNEERATTDCTHQVVSQVLWYSSIRYRILDGRPKGTHVGDEALTYCCHQTVPRAPAPAHPSLGQELYHAVRRARFAEDSRCLFDRGRQAGRLDFHKRRGRRGKGDGRSLRAICQVKRKRLGLTYIAKLKKYGQVSIVAKTTSLLALP